MIEGIIKYNKNRQQEKAKYDYILANEISIAVGRLISKEAKMPELEEFYPDIFDKEILEKRKRRQLKDRLMAAFNVINSKKGSDLNDDT